MTRLCKRLLGVCAAIGLAAFAAAQIERLNLTQMVDRSDGSVYAAITSKHVFRVDHPVDGAELYYTVLGLQGRSLVDGRKVQLEVTYPGGFIDEDQGVWNSEAPSEEDTRLGNRVVVFYKWVQNMGGDVAGNAIYAMHGGLYRTSDGPEGTVVLGRGDGYAVDKNSTLSNLETSVRELAHAKK